MVVENQKMVDSFAVVSFELHTLSENLQNAEDLRERLRIEKLEADKKLETAKLEIEMAETAKMEAENISIVAEQLAAEALKKNAIESESLKKDTVKEQAIIPPPHSVSAETNESIVEETIASSVITKQIHIYQKVL